MANELEALIRQIVSDIEGAKGNATQYSAPHTSSTPNTAVVDRVVTQLLSCCRNDKGK